MSKRTREMRSEEDEEALENLEHIVAVIAQKDDDDDTNYDPTASPLYLILKFEDPILLPIARRMLLTEVDNVAKISHDLRVSIKDVLTTLFTHAERDAIARLKAWGGWTWGTLEGFVGPLYNVCTASKEGGLDLEWLMTKVNDIYEPLTKQQQCRLHIKLMHLVRFQDDYAETGSIMDQWLGSVIYRGKDHPSYWSVFVSVFNKVSREYWQYNKMRNMDLLKEMIQLWAEHDMYPALLWCLYVTFDWVTKAEARPPNTPNLRDLRVQDYAQFEDSYKTATQLVIHYILVPKVPVDNFSRYHLFNEYWWFKNDPTNQAHDQRILHLHHPNTPEPTETAFRFPTTRLFVRYLLARYPEGQTGSLYFSAIAAMNPRASDPPERSWDDLYLPFSDYGPEELHFIINDEWDDHIRGRPDVTQALYQAAANLIYEKPKEMAKWLILSVQNLPHMQILDDFWPILELFPHDRQAHQVYRNLATKFINDDSFPQLLTHPALDGDPILNPLKSQPESLFQTLVNALIHHLEATFIDPYVLNIVALWDWEHPRTHEKLPPLSNAQWWAHFRVPFAVTKVLTNVEFNHVALSDLERDRLAELLVNGCVLSNPENRPLDMIKYLFLQLPARLPSLAYDNGAAARKEWLSVFATWTHALGRVTKLLSYVEESLLYVNDNMPLFLAGSIPPFMDILHAMKRAFNPLGLRETSKIAAFWDTWLKRQLSQK
jgi:hypothetical protein